MFVCLVETAPGVVLRASYWTSQEKAEANAARCPGVTAIEELKLGVSRIVWTRPLTVEE